MTKLKQRIIKKYSNRRLYDTQESEYITQDRIKDYVNRGIVFRVVSSKTGEDITRSVLLHVILDEEVMGVPLFTEEALRSIILFSGSGMRSSFSSFLEQMLPMLQQSQIPEQPFMTQVPGVPGNSDRIQEQLATLQGMLLGNSFSEYLNRSMDMMGKINSEIAKNTARLINPDQPEGSQQAAKKLSPKPKGKKHKGG